MTTPEQSLAARLDRVECQVRRTKVVGGTALAIGGVVLIAVLLVTISARRDLSDAQSKASRTVIEAEALILRDHSGAIQARMSTDMLGAAQLTFFGKNGEQRATLGREGLSLSDTRGNRRASFSMIGSAANESWSPVVQLLDEESHARAALMLLADGSPRLLLSAKDGGAAATLDAATDGSSRLGIFDGNGKNAAWIGALRDGSRGLVMSDQHEDAAATLGISPDGAIGLHLADRSRRERATLALSADGGSVLDLYGPEGRGTASVGVTANGAPVLEIIDADARSSGEFIAAKGAVGLMFRDQDAHEVAGLISEPGRKQLFLSGEAEKGGALLAVREGGVAQFALFDRRGHARALLGQHSPGKRKPSDESSAVDPFSLILLDRSGNVVYRVPRGSR